MASGRSRPTSVSTSNSLMQDVPGTFLTPLMPPDDDESASGEPHYQSLSQAVYARRSEYVQPKHVRIKIGTWNVAAFKGAEKDLDGWFVGGKGISDYLTDLSLEEQAGIEERESVDAQEARYSRKEATIPKGDTGTLPGHEDVGLYALCLQEVVDISSATEALRPYTDPSVARRWKDAMIAALPDGYELVVEQQLLGLLLLIFAAKDVAHDIKSVSTTSVGTGLMGYMGNKGAVTARIVLGETTRLVFVNCHLAAGADKAALERRNWDAQQVVSRTRFDPIHDAMDLAQTTGEQIGDEDFAFWAGDLNYRLEGIPGDDVRRLLMLHTRNEYDLSQRSANKIEDELRSTTDAIHRRIGSVDSASSTVPPSPSRSSAYTRASTESTAPSTLIDEVEASEDPTSLQTTLSSLLPHDELHQQIKSRKAFHDGWREGPITFIPTYKYDAGSVGVFDSSEKKRAPSWCDRILYRTRRDKTNYDDQIREEENARKKDAEMRANGTDQAANDEEILYDYDPETDGVNRTDDYDDYDETNDGVVMTKEGFEDEIELEHYTAHQRVISSDHKPLAAVFKLKYDAVVPELKAKIHAEVAKELDKAENDSRPNIVVVVDKHSGLKESDECPEHKFEGVWFGDVRYGQTKHRSLTIANTGRVPASFNFIERPIMDGQSPGIAPRWLSLKLDHVNVASSSISTAQTMLEPGDACIVDIEIHISQPEDIQDLNEGKHAIDDILVLRVENGRDHFIPLRGNWLETTLGRSIDKLTRIPEGGIRKLQRQKPQGNQGSTSRQRSISNASSQTPAHGAPESSTEQEPVRFSAPRELFRLTEAIEDLCTRVIAEWEMTQPAFVPGDAADEAVGNAPWNKHAGWPFEAASWTEQGTTQWNVALSDACNALDCDEALDPSMADDLPRIQRLHVLCSLLLLFLNSMLDGVINAELWSDIEQYLADNDKAKRKPAFDEQRTAISELMSQSPGHSISFILITSMLERIVLEIAGTEKANGDVPMSPTKLAGSALKRMSMMGRPPAVSHTDLANAALARIFADPIIHSSTPGSEKVKAGQERRKIEVIDMFLRGSQSI